MNIRCITLTAAAALASCIAAGPVGAQQLKLQVNRQTGEFSLTGADAMAVDFAGYEIVSDRASMVPANWNGLGDTEPGGWVAIDDISAEKLNELVSSGNPTDGAVVNDTVSLSLGVGVYNPAPILAGLPLGEDVESNDLSLTYYNQILDQVLPGVVEFTGEKIFNNVGITVDLATGRAYLENESPNNLTVSGYLIESATSGLLSTNTSTFDGLGGSFQAPGTFDGENIGELDPTGAGQAFASSMSASVLGTDLGIVVDPGSLSAAFEDLSFSFILAGNGESSRTGFVKYINVPEGLDGDFNNDGVVDSIDYAIWRENLGGDSDAVLNGNGDDVPGVTSGDFDVWIANYGATASGSGVAPLTTPEPTTALLLAMAGLAGAWATRR